MWLPFSYPPFQSNLCPISKKSLLNYIILSPVNTRWFVRKTAESYPKTNHASAVSSQSMSFSITFSSVALLRIPRSNNKP